MTEYRKALHGNRRHIQRLMRGVDAVAWCGVTLTAVVRQSFGPMCRRCAYNYAASRQKDIPVTEPSPIRNNGPFFNAAEALKQYSAQTHGMPLDNEALCGMVIREALMMSGVNLGNHFEVEYLSASLERSYDPIMAQIIAGWIIRAYMSGVDVGKGKF